MIVVFTKGKQNQYLYKTLFIHLTLQCYLCPLAVFSFFGLVAFLVNLQLIISNVFTDCEALCNLLLKSAMHTKIIILRGILSL